MHGLPAAAWDRSRKWSNEPPYGIFPFAQDHTVPQPFRSFLRKGWVPIALRSTLIPRML